jgi:hypothetical protein
LRFQPLFWSVVVFPPVDVTKPPNHSGSPDLFT